MATNPNSASSSTAIARLNDDARLGLDRRARILFTRNCLETFCAKAGAHPALIQAELLRAFRTCDFAADSPEHDFASILYRDRKVWMKIDCYDLDCQFGSENPANAAITTRVITFLLPEDW